MFWENETSNKIYYVTLDCLKALQCNFLSDV